MIVQPVVELMDRFTALHVTLLRGVDGGVEVHVEGGEQHQQQQRARPQQHHQQQLLHRHRVSQ